MASSFFMICNLMMIAAALARPQNVEWQPQVVGLPYYGGARGQVLQITRDQNGAILNQVIVPVVDAQQNAATFFQPQNFQDPTNANFDMSFYNLQTSAQRLVDLQQKIQRTGQLEPQERTDFNSNLALLGQSASNLAQSSASGQGLEALLGSQGMRTTSDANGVEKNGELPADENEEDVGEELGTEGDSNVVTQEDTVLINGPPDSASVAEAKPVGLAIAGEGGVASSKPMATAVVGPGGLAIARPVATAIAGVDPRTAGVPIPSSAKAPSAPIAAFRRRADHLLAGRLN